MKMRLLAAAIALLCWAAATPAGAGEAKFTVKAGPRAGTGAWIADVRSYWRYHYTFRPAQSWSPKDGKLRFVPTRYGALNTRTTGNRLATPEPPADWKDPKFDDSGWPVNRAPLPWMPEMDQDGQGPYCCHVIRKACGRTRFLVPDPAKVKQLSLDVAYHGGLIVWVNGTEVARGHVAPDGPLAAEGFAEPYPPEAYRDGKDWWPPQLPYHRWRYEKRPEMVARIKAIDAARGRVLKVDVPASALRPGVNVLAVENRLSPILAFEGKRGPVVSRWYVRVPHIGISRISLTPTPPDAVRSADLRPAGVQVWARDIHQWTLSEDFLEPGVAQNRILRVIAPRNGACSAGAVIGTDRELASPSATVTGLTGPGGARIPASAVSVRWARPLALRKVKSMHRVAFFTYMPDRWLIRYRGAPADTWVAYWTDHWGEGGLLRDLWKSDDMQVFDQLDGRAPAAIPAGTCQPVWITAEVPADAAPGLYTGSLAVKAGGAQETKLEVRLQVFDYASPDPREFTAYAGIDESPWALAQWAGVELWSEEHWKLVEGSVRMAGKLGARTAGIPVIHKTELNNGSDAMIKWVAKPGGKYDFDFTLADRYLDLWRKYCHGRPDIIFYLVLPADVYGRGGGTGTVTLVEGGKEKTFTPPKAEDPEGLKLWMDCAAAIHSHFKARGISDANMHWGLFYDYIGKSGFALAGPLSEKFPGVGWARSSHQGRKIHGNAEMGGGDRVKVTWNAAVRAEQKPPFSKEGKVTPLKGWSNPQARLLLPRADSDVNALSILPPLWQLREVQEMPVTSLYRGFGRICVDGWGRCGYFGPFNPWLVYPAEGGGINGSIQLEVLREGLQETEARIFLEKKEQHSPTARKVLDLRTERVWMIPPRPEGQRIAEYFPGWQEMSWDLYAAAAAASGGRVPSEEDRKRFLADKQTAKGGRP